MPEQEAGLADVANAWEDVKDFKWHRAQKSPNWSVIPESDRESNYLSNDRTGADEDGHTATIIA